MGSVDMPIRLSFWERERERERESVRLGMIEEVLGTPAVIELL
jgi:hypothetical protein